MYATDFHGNLVVVVGSEGEGIRPLVRKHCDGLLAIPQYGGVSSLNASVAGGIVLFEAARQRCKP
jgi:23S rRNA (guanosine2251-2'-O)-methyltransferase